MLRRKRKPKKTLLERSLDLQYDTWHPQDKYKDHPYVGRIFKHPSKQTDIIVVAYKNDKTWWYRDTIKKDLFVDTTIKERKAKWKLKWLEKKGLEIEEPRAFGFDRMKRYKRKYRGGEDT